MTTDDPAATEDFASMLAEFEGSQPKARRRPKVGDQVSGRVVSIGKDAVFVDLGGKAEGQLDRNQLTDADDQLKVAVGDTIEARVVADAGGMLELRVKIARGPEARAELVTAFELGLPVEGTIKEVIKGGVAVDVAGVRGFCPASQVDARFVEDLAPLVGQRLTFRITRYEPNPRGGNLVVSRRAVLEEEQAKAAAILRETLVPGAVVRGKVVGFKPFGAFVDLGGLEGLLHISQLGHSRIARPEDVLALGQELDVEVLKIEPPEPRTDGKRATERISLSLKSLAEDPWQETARALGEGMAVKGKVTRLQPFGAFVEVAPGVEGLIHISALGTGRHVQHPREVLQVGQEVEATVVVVDLERRRLSLSLGAGDGITAADVAEFGQRQGAPAGKLGTLGDLLAKAKPGKR
ncbi:MAG: S1 RNA-binding domain-containing protein [Kofleriaceae bacterium]